MISKTLWFLVFLLVATVVCFAFVVVPSFFSAYKVVPLSSYKTFTVSKGSSAFEIAKKLKKEGIIEDSYKFLLFSYLSGRYNKFQSGEYGFNPFLRPVDIAQKMVRGEVIKYIILVKEGDTVYNVAESIEKAYLGSKEDVLRISKDREFIKSLGLDVSSLEGYLFPAVYYFTAKDNPKTVLKRMVREFNRRFKKEWVDRAKSLSLTVHEIVTMASLIEKEAVKNEERPIIAGVFYNRLRIGMPLQSDPTAVYDLENFKGTITRGHLERESPYNTYIIKGLPPGPICNPGLDSIRAALYPADVPFLYFVSDRRGSHRFSVTYEEHLKAIKEINESLSQKENPPDL